MGTLDEQSLPMTMAPVLINLTKELAKDRKALQNLSMDRTSATCKMTHGLTKTIRERTLKTLRISPFSFNIDEATSNNNKHVLAVLVSYFLESEGRIVLDHLTSIELATVDTSSLLEAIDEVFNSNGIPWVNVVSILMDSCAVMRGSKNGLEKKIRESKAPALLDIDGDICHRMHNASKTLCAPFDYWVESLFTDLHTDHRWSVDLREKLAEVCEILGIKFTTPENL